MSIMMMIHYYVTSYSNHNKGFKTSFMQPHTHMLRLATQFCVTWQKMRVDHIQRSMLTRQLHNTYTWLLWLQKCGLTAFNDLCRRRGCMSKYAQWLRPHICFQPIQFEIWNPIQKFKIKKEIKTHNTTILFVSPFLHEIQALTQSCLPPTTSTLFQPSTSSSNRLCLSLAWSNLLEASWRHSAWSNCLYIFFVHLHVPLNICHFLAWSNLLELPQPPLAWNLIQIPLAISVILYYLWVSPAKFVFLWRSRLLLSASSKSRRVRIFKVLRFLAISIFHCSVCSLFSLLSWTKDYTSSYLYIDFALDFAHKL